MTTAKDRLMESIYSLRREGKAVNVSSVSRRARLNRSGLYKSHSEIVKLIQAPIKEQRKLEAHEQLAAKLQKQLRLTSQQKKTVEALARLCVELNVALQRSAKQRKRDAKKAERQIAALSRENSDLRRNYSKVMRMN